MKLRTFVITAGAVVALVAPTAAFAAGSRAPAHNHATTSDSSLADLESGHGQAAGNDAAALRAQLRAAERRAAKLGAQLRAVKVSSASMRAQLRAVKQLVTSLRAQLDAAVRAAQNATGSGSVGGGGNAGGGDAVGYCQSYMVDCTDEELCKYWGMNCWLVERVTPPVTELVEAASRAGSAIGS